MRKTIYLIGILIFFSVTICYAKDYYVSEYGSDVTANINLPGPGSNACRTIMYLINNVDLQGGDIVYIQAGTYQENVKVTSADDGSDGAYVTFKTYQNDDVIILSSNSNYPFQIYDSNGWTEYVKLDGSGIDGGQHLRLTTTASDRCLMIRYARYIWITNLEIDNAATKDNIKLTSKNQGTDSSPPGTDDDTGPKNVIIEYNKIHNGGDYGIKLTGWGTANNHIRYNDIYNNGGRGADNYGMNVSGSGYAANTAHNNEIYGNNFYSNHDSGLQFTYTSGNKIYNNRFYDNGTGEPGRGLSFGTSASNNIAFNNEIYNNAYYGLECYKADGNKIYNNIIYRNQNNEIRIQSGSKNNEIYNNTIFGESNVGIYLSSDTTGTKIKNNIIYVFGGNPALHNGGGGTGVLDYNNWYMETNPSAIYWDGDWKTVSEFYIDTGNGNHSISIDPLFQNLVANDFTLQNSSPCIDVGTTLAVEGIYEDREGITRPQNVTWDLGAYESISPPSTTAPPSHLRLK